MIDTPHHVCEPDDESAAKGCVPMMIQFETPKSIRRRREEERPQISFFFTVPRFSASPHNRSLQRFVRDRRFFDNESLLQVNYEWRCTTLTWTSGRLEP